MLFRSFRGGMETWLLRKYTLSLLRGSLEKTAKMKSESGLNDGDQTVEKSNGIKFVLSS